MVVTANNSVCNLLLIRSPINSFNLLMTTSSTSSSLALKLWVGLCRAYKTSPVACIRCEVTTVVHPKGSHVAMHLVLPLDAWAPLLPLPSHKSRIEGIFRWSINLCIRWIFMRYLELIQIPSSSIFSAHADGSTHLVENSFFEYFITFHHRSSFGAV